MVNPPKILQANIHLSSTNTKDPNLMAAKSPLADSSSSVQSLWGSDYFLFLLDFDPKEARVSMPPQDLLYQTSI